MEIVMTLGMTWILRLQMQRWYHQKNPLHFYKEVLVEGNRCHTINYVIIQSVGTVTIDISTHLIQSVRSAWHAKLPFVRDPRHMLFINDWFAHEEPECWECKFIHKWKMTSHSKTQYALRTGRAKKVIQKLFLVLKSEGVKVYNSNRWVWQDENLQLKEASVTG